MSSAAPDSGASFPESHYATLSSPVAVATVNPAGAALGSAGSAAPAAATAVTPVPAGGGASYTSTSGFDTSGVRTAAAQSAFRSGDADQSKLVHSAPSPPEL